MKIAISILALLIISNLTLAQWTQQNSGTINTLGGVSFIDGNYGTVVGLNGTILRTTNGGLNWTPQVSGTTNNLVAVSFTDVNHGTVVGHNGTILRTTNGGLNWTPQVSGTSNHLFGVLFKNINNGTIVGGNDVGDGGLILHTTNGGDNWYTQLSGAYNLYGVDFLNINLGTVVGSRGEIFRTTNGGNSWIPQTIAYQDWNIEVALLNEDIGIATIGNWINRTSDGGNNWYHVPGTNSSRALFAVSFANLNKGIVVGGSNLESIILRSNDSGITWFEQESGTDNSLYDVCFVDENNAWAVGKGGIILKYSDNNYVSLNILLKSQATGQILPNTKIDLAYTAPNSLTNIISAQTNMSGLATFQLPNNSDFTAMINKPGYNPYIKTYLNNNTNRSVTFYLTDFTNKKSYSFPDIITGLFDLGTLNSSGICSAFDNNSPPGSNIYKIDDFVFNNYSNQSFDYYFLTVEPLENYSFQPETVPAVLIKPNSSNEIGSLICNLVDLAVPFFQIVYNLPSYGNTFLPSCGTLQNVVVDANGYEYTSTSILFGQIEFRKSTGNNVGNYSALDQLLIDNLGRKTGSYYENGVFIEDKYEIPSTCYSGHLSHPNRVFLETGIETQITTYNLIPTSLGEYTSIKSKITQTSVFENVIVDTATSFNPILITNIFPDSTNSPTAIIVLLSDSISSGELQTFNGTNSSDPQGLPLSLEWYLNNEFISNEIIFSQYLADGEYTITLILTNTLGNNSTESRSFLVGNAIQTFQMTVTVYDGWNMVAIPGLHPINQNVNTWWAFRELGANVYKFDGSYQTVTDATTGLGYWMKHSGDRTYNTNDEWPTDGINLNTHNPLTGNAGWNLIGGYEISVETEGITTNPPGQLTQPMFKFSNGYQIATTIDPGYGYWAKLTSAAQIILPEALAKAKKPIEYFKQDWGKIILKDAKEVSYTLYATKGQVNLDNYELPPPPPAGLFDIRYSSGRIAEDLSSGIQLIEMSGITYPLTIRVDGMDMRLTDETGEKINVNLKSGEDVVISDATIKKLQVMGESILLVYTLEQNYPNPFNPNTMIKFSIAKEVQTNLSVYNILGETVRELKNEIMKPGYYQVEFNASSLASGIYFYRIKAGDFVESKKMVLLK